MARRYVRDSIGRFAPTGGGGAPKKSSVGKPGRKVGKESLGARLTKQSRLVQTIANAPFNNYRDGLGAFKVASTIESAMREKLRKQSAGQRKQK